MISDVDRHESLGVKRRPADEECNHDCNCHHVQSQQSFMQYDAAVIYGLSLYCSLISADLKSISAQKPAYTST